MTIDINYINILIDVKLLTWRMAGMIRRWSGE